MHDVATVDYLHFEQEAIIIEVLVNLNDKVTRIIALLVFGSKNPKTNQHNVNISYLKDGVQRCIQLDCRDDETGNLVMGIRAGEVSDLSEYTAHEIDE